MDMQQIRCEVFSLYEIPVTDPWVCPPHLTLKRAHYTYISDPNFDKQALEISTKQEKLLTKM